ncbi:glycine cleavage system protein GcvH [Halalkalibacterium halodurans]|jgi:glycine cleavage system H protein|uniref:Glycine cleavage system H protein n=1 Tax=Halalkalibacterium halodurans TaxID=86665 RepID=A0A0M0KG37_ALKHA|nr:glycine cleavage system protein GcvH [Halalkalibacterium halodurans]MED3646659.1 glycine cleavage system protein GcvH [Halalkalibacterium halodurans]MED4164245.1 glycine cleavage system protein GcvH [Halalkalibacterium halodurans]TES52412.1 glycine cleavage system protein GcvH [Halalkalibacterium halodurans]TPE66500.1 glycine cleavage system protein GcvH [Halalkalibacterium halodurans]
MKDLLRRSLKVSNLPNELKYSEEHEWVKVEGDKVRIGITDFAQSELGDIVFVELPEVGDEVEADEPFGSVESVKTVSELYAPVSGKVVEVNEELDDNPEYVNESPYEKAWMIVVEPSDASQVEELMSADEYKEMISEE